MHSAPKGFTLLEILIVITILAILVVAVVVALNPAELIRQSRDSARLSDLNTLSRALGRYLSDVTSPTLASATYTSRCYVSTTSTISANCGGRHVGTTTTSPTPQMVNGLGWLGSDGVTPGPDFTSVSSGSPLPTLPLDPINNGTYFYSYAADTGNNTFELDAKMESIKYQNGGSKDVESTDGGNNPAMYEVGNSGGLAL